MARKTLTFALFALMTLTAHAQRFDWVKTYMGQDINQIMTNEIIGSVVDTADNLYILGHFGPGAAISGEDLLPFSGTNRGVLIAKFSPQGDLLWKKVIHSRIDNSFAHDIRMMGDSAFMVMASFTLPHWNSSSDFNQLYYLDTLLTEDNGFLVNTDSIGSYTVNGFLTFNLDGSVLEQQFLQVAMNDNDGNTLPSNWYNNDGRAYTNILSNELFDIDEAGNIYVCRFGSDRRLRTCDTCPTGSIEYSVENGGVSALKIIVNGTRSLYLYPTNRPYGWSQQIIVFSPHFGNILRHTYLFDTIEGNSQTRPSIKLKSFDLDHRGNLYLTLSGSALNASDGNSARLRLTNSNGLYWESSATNASDGCVVKMDRTLHPEFIKQLGCTADPTGFSKVYTMNSVTFDTASNTFFVLGHVSRDPLFQTTEGVYVTYGEDTLNLRNNLYWVRLGLNEGNLISYGSVGSTVFSGIPTNAGCNIVAKDNRVMSHFISRFNTIFHDSTITNPSEYDFGLMMWDYDGHQIQYIDYTAGSINSKANIVHLADSTLYLCGSLYCGAQLGNYTISPSSNSTVYLARYIDTVFMTPYVYIDPRAEQSIEWEQELSFPLSASPIALTATASSGLPVSYSCADTSIAKVVGSLLYLFSAGTTTVTAYQNGSQYGYYPATPITKNLTGDVRITLVEDGAALVAYPNPFRQSVRIKVQGGQLKEHNGTVTAILTDLSGRREEVRLTPIGSGQYSLDLTSRPQATYLLTLTTADGKQHTVRLLKQSDIFDE